MATHHATPLTARQLEVLEGAAEGESVKETASRLHVSVDTVKMHRKGIRRALATTNTSRAVHRARELGLLGPTLAVPIGHVCVVCDDAGCEFCPADRSQRLVERALLKVCLARDLSVLRDAEALALSAALLARLDADSVAS